MDCFEADASRNDGVEANSRTKNSANSSTNSNANSRTQRVAKQNDGVVGLKLRENLTKIQGSKKAANSSTNLNANSSYKLPYFLEFVAKFGLFVLGALLIWVFLMPLSNAELTLSNASLGMLDGAQQKEAFRLYYFAFCGLFCVIFAFAAFKDTRRFYNAAALFGILGVILFVCEFCISNFAILFSILIKDYYVSHMIDVIFSIGVIVGELVVLLFLGAFREFDATKSMFFRVIFRILQIFAIAYIALLAVYFIILFLNPESVISPGVFYPYGYDETAGVVYLVFWFSLFFLVLLWMNEGLKGENLATNLNKFRAFFSGKSLFFIFSLLAILALNSVAFYSILKRIFEYGFTPNRYFVFMGCVFLFIAVVITFFKKEPLRSVFAVAFVLVFISGFGPLNAINLSINSQVKRFEKALDTGDVKSYLELNNYLKDHMSKDDYAALIDKSAPILVTWFEYAFDYDESAYVTIVNSLKLLSDERKAEFADYFGEDEKLCCDFELIKTGYAPKSKFINKNTVRYQQKFDISALNLNAGSYKELIYIEQNYYEDMRVQIPPRSMIKINSKYAFYFSGDDNGDLVIVIRPDGDHYPVVILDDFLRLVHELNDDENIIYAPNAKIVLKEIEYNRIYKNGKYEYEILNINALVFLR